VRSAARRGNERGYDAINIQRAHATSWLSHLPLWHDAIGQRIEFGDGLPMDHARVGVWSLTQR